MALKFGTSGVRGLVEEMTDKACYLYTRAFLLHLAEKSQAAAVALAGDHRSSTPRIMGAVARAILDHGAQLVNCGRTSTPAVASYAMARGWASIMVTGSHIPDDRNGIKFNLPWGEVLKPDELAITQHFAGLQKRDWPAFDAAEALDAPLAVDLRDVDGQAAVDYERRTTDFFVGRPLTGRKVVVYQHSSVSRESLPRVLEALGAEVVRVGWSDAFVPVDTEAVAEPERLAAWVAEHEADALVSTDGDGDRPLLVDEHGLVVRGDVLGILVSDFLDADVVVAPVSCNGALELCGRFAQTLRTRIGSPYVIEAMQAAAGRVVVGYEANGGYLTHSDLVDGERVLTALPTRDAFLPLVAALCSAATRNLPVSALVADLPSRFTWSGVIRGIPTERSAALVARLERDADAVVTELFAGANGPLAHLDFTDGARLTCDSGDVVHFRPSGNAPEFRCYTECDSTTRAEALNGEALERVRALLS